jgi:hypothetical protein
MGETLMIEIDDSLNKYVYREVEHSGIVSINGITPMQGNIDITGVGGLMIRTSGENRQSK